MWLVCGKKSGLWARRRGILGVFSVSSCLMVCRNWLFLNWGLERFRSIQSRLQWIFYSTAEHAITNLRVCLAWTELQQRLALCLDKTSDWLNDSSWPLESDSRNSSDSDVASRRLFVLVTILCNNNRNQGMRIVVLQVVVTVVYAADVFKALSAIIGNCTRI